MARRMSSITAVGLASLALAPAAVAQVPDVTDGADSEYSAAAEPTPAPTPVPTPTPAPQDDSADVGEIGAPPPDASKRVRRVYRDFRRDAIIEPCDHTLYILRETRDSVPEDFDAQYPDFLESVKAAISERKTLDCDALAKEQADEDAEREEDADAGEDAGSDEDADADEGASTGGGGTPSPVITPAPIDPLPIDPLPATPSDSDDELAPDPLPPVETVAPLPEPAPAPAAPVAPPVAPPVATPAPSTVEAEPASAPAPVWGLAAGGGLLALGGLLAPLLGARGGARLAAFEHAWGEAGFRIRGAWQDFRDWLRVGR